MRLKIVLTLKICFLFGLMIFCQSNGRPSKYGNLYVTTGYQWMEKGEYAPNITIELRHKNQIVTINTGEYGAYDMDLEPGSYFVVRALDSAGKEIEFLLDQPRCIEVKKGEEQLFGIMLRPPSMPAQPKRHDFSQCDCESKEYGFLQGDVEYVEVGNSRQAVGVTVKLRHGKKIVVIRTDDYGEYLEKLEPGKYCIKEVLGTDGRKLRLFKGQEKCTYVRPKDCLRFYIELVPPSKVPSVPEAPHAR